MWERLTPGAAHWRPTVLSAPVTTAALIILEADSEISSPQRALSTTVAPYELVSFCILHSCCGNRAFLLCCTYLRISNQDDLSVRTIDMVGIDRIGNGSRTS